MSNIFDSIRNWVIEKSDVQHVGFLGSSFHTPVSQESLFAAKEIWAPCEGAEGCGSGPGCDCAGDCPNDDPSNSTPFICVWDGQQYVYENDFLFGKPGTFFGNASDGKVWYEAGGIGHDYYKIQTHPNIENGLLRFQIKEVEPEESYIDYLSMLSVVSPIGSTVVVDSNHNKYTAFDTTEIENRHGIRSERISLNGKEVETGLLDGDGVLNGTPGDSEDHTMAPGDYIEAEASVDISSGGEDLYVFIRSHFRDWVASEFSSLLDETLNVHKKGIKDELRETVRALSTRMFVQSIARIPVLLVALVIVSAASLFQYSAGQRTSNNLNQSLIPVVENTIPSAHASHPTGCNSLVVEYYDGTSFVFVDVIEPRFYRPTTEAVKIPKEAIAKNGKVRIKITSTKYHRVWGVALAKPERTHSTRFEKLLLKTAYHLKEQKDYTAILNSQRNGEYMHLIPGDVVDIEFADSTKAFGSGEKREFVLVAGGIYTPLSKEVELELGNWIAELDAEAREWLKHKYSLKNYQQKDRAPVLS